MSLLEKIQSKNIDEVLHFTLDNNLIGIITNGGLLSRQALDFKTIDYQKLEFANEIVWLDRNRDLEWTGYISLSIESINEFLLNRARSNHPNQKWFILSFDKEILCHEGVHFTTTNNAYVPHVIRGAGCEGFDFSFSRSYRDRLGNIHVRNVDLDSKYPTSQQAEVLYPSKLSLHHLKKIYVENEEGFQHATYVIGYKDFLPDCPPFNVQVIIDPTKFNANTNQRVY